MLEFSEEQFDDVKTKGEVFYKNIGDIYCSYLKEKVSFNTKGIEHLKFKHRWQSRPEKDQYMRFKLIHLAPEVLKLSHTVQGILETKKFEKIKISSRTDTILKPVTYFDFTAVIKRNRVKIIVKQVENGQKFFWSIIPFWRMNRETMTRILHDGNPEED
jgi:hypothetical protein